MILNLEDALGMRHHYNRTTVTIDGTPSMLVDETIRLLKLIAS